MGAYNNNTKSVKMNKSLYIKIIVALYAILLFAIESSAQSFKNIDKAPHDIAYLRETQAMPPLVKVVYGRPSVAAGEEAFGSKVPFNELWRTGANEATEIKLYQDTEIGGVIIKAGTYTLLTIPSEKDWEVIISRQLDVWGAFQYDSSFDVARVKVPVSKAENLDSFSIAFKRNESDINMVLGWGSTRVKVPMKIKDYYFAGL